MWNLEEVLHKKYRTFSPSSGDDCVNVRKVIKHTWNIKWWDVLRSIKKKIYDEYRVKEKKRTKETFTFTFEKVYRNYKDFKDK